jgi:hypothetical protein
MTLQLHRPDGEGGLEARPSEPEWQAQLRSPRWGAGLRRKRLPDLKNSEMEPTSTLLAILFWIGLAFATFVLLIVGYGTGFWS